MNSRIYTDVTINHVIALIDGAKKDIANRRKGAANGKLSSAVGTLLGLTEDHDETTVIAALALAAQEYADPSAVLSELARWSPAAAKSVSEGLARREAERQEVPATLER